MGKILSTWLLTSPLLSSLEQEGMLVYYFLDFFLPCMDILACALKKFFLPVLLFCPSLPALISTLLALKFFPPCLFILVRSPLDFENIPCLPVYFGLVTPTWDIRLSLKKIHN